MERQAAKLEQKNNARRTVQIDLIDESDEAEDEVPRSQKKSIIPSAHATSSLSIEPPCPTALRKPESVLRLDKSAEGRPSRFVGHFARWRLSKRSNDGRPKA